MMTNLSVHKPFDMQGLASGATLVTRRLLPGRVVAGDRIGVDVRVRSYGDSLPAVRPMPALRPQMGLLPVGTFLDCYL